jgi:hypothetical protein
MNNLQKIKNFGGKGMGCCGCDLSGWFGGLYGLRGLCGMSSFFEYFGRGCS